MEHETHVEDETVAAEAAEAEVPGGPDRPPTPGEEAAAEAATGDLDDTALDRVAEHHREMDRIGAATEGEGRIP